MTFEKIETLAKGYIQSFYFVSIADIEVSIFVISVASFTFDV